MDFIDIREYDDIEVSCENSKSVCVPHLARLSQLCRRWPRPCSRRVPAKRGVLAFIFVSISHKCLSISYFIYTFREGGGIPGWCERYNC